MPATKPLAPAQSPAIPIDIRRALSQIQASVNTAHARLDDHKQQIDAKMGTSPIDLLNLAAQMRSRLQANGSHPLSIAGLPGVAAQAQNTGTSTSTTISNAASQTVADIHDNRSGYPAQNLANGALYFETDRAALYINVAATWTYAAGCMTGAVSTLPTDLGTSDTGFQFFATDTHDFYVWTGSAWLINGATWG